MRLRRGGRDEASATTVAPPGARSYPRGHPLAPPPTTIDTPTSVTPPSASSIPEQLPALPDAPIDRLSAPFVRFLHTASASGIVLLIAAAIALVLANSPWRHAVQDFWNTPFTIGAEGFALSYPLWYWVNDGLMTLFFFVIGLEIKRELVHGELSDRRKVTLPVIAALGGAAVPALVFLLVLGDNAGTRAWAVPMATDIAFVVGILALLGSRVPSGLKVFLLSLAIVDDIIAVLIIAFFYSGALSLAWIVAAVAGFGVLAVLNRSGVRSVGVYVLAGALIWLCTLKSGIHPTVAGVFLGLLTPASAWLARSHLSQSMEVTQEALARGDDQAQRTCVAHLQRVALESVSPLARLEHNLHPWVAFAIMPLFALVNAGVALEPSTLTSPLAIAIAAGLLVGKTLGVSVAAWIAVRSGAARLPSGVTWPVVIAGGLLSGIGFTMSLFIASLGLEGEMLASAKGGILLGSLVAGVGGYVLLRRLLKAPEPSAA